MLYIMFHSLQTSSFSSSFINSSYRDGSGLSHSHSQRSPVGSPIDSSGFQKISGLSIRQRSYSRINTSANVSPILFLPRPVKCAKSGDANAGVYDSQSLKAFCPPIAARASQYAHPSSSATSRWNRINLSRVGFETI